MQELSIVHLQDTPQYRLTELHPQEIILGYPERSPPEEDKNVIFMLRRLIKTGMKFDSPFLN